MLTIVNPGTHLLVSGEQALRLRQDLVDLAEQTAAVQPHPSSALEVPLLSLAALAASDVIVAQQKNGKGSCSVHQYFRQKRHALHSQAQQTPPVRLCLEMLWRLFVAASSAAAPGVS